MTSNLNTKNLQLVDNTEDCYVKLLQNNYYKYRAANPMFGMNSIVMK